MLPSGIGIWAELTGSPGIICALRLSAKQKRMNPNTKRQRRRMATLLPHRAQGISCSFEEGGPKWRKDSTFRNGVWGKDFHRLWNAELGRFWAGADSLRAGSGQALPLVGMTSLV